MPHFKDLPLMPDQLMLFSTSVDSAVRADSDVRVINEIMDLLDWSDMEKSYSNNGCPAYPPCVMTKLLAYAYYNGVRSSRKIEALIENDKRYIWLSGGLTPDFHTLARFRRAKWHQLVALFDDTVRLCAEAGMVFLKSVSIDGSKIPGAASSKSVYDAKRIARERKQIEKVLEEAEQADHAEDEQYGSGNGRELPAELTNALERKKLLEKAAKLLETNKRDKVVLTDPESRLMKTRHGIKSSYNLQAAVDVENQVIIAMDVVDNESDHGLLMPMIEKVERVIGMSADTFLADSGYCDEEALLELESSGRDALMPLLVNAKGKREHLFRSENFVHDEERDVLICPAGHELCFKRIHKKCHGVYKVYAAKGCQSCSFYKQCAGGKSSRTVERSIAYKMREKMRERLKSADGKKQYKLRSQSVEPVFGQMKKNRCFDRLLLCGMNGAKAELALAFIAHNISKCARLLDKNVIAKLSSICRAIFGIIYRAIMTVQELKRTLLSQNCICNISA